MMSSATASSACLLDSICYDDGALLISDPKKTGITSGHVDAEVPDEDMLMRSRLVARAV